MSIFISDKHFVLLIQRFKPVKISYGDFAFCSIRRIMTGSLLIGLNILFHSKSKLSVEAAEGCHW